MTINSTTCRFNVASFLFKISADGKTFHCFWMKAVFLTVTRNRLSRLLRFSFHCFECHCSHFYAHYSNAGTEEVNVKVSSEPSSADKIYSHATTCISGSAVLYSVSEWLHG